MSKVYLEDRTYDTTKEKFVVELPNFKYLIFKIDEDYFIDEISGNTPISEDFVDFICCCDEYDNILNSAIRRSLPILTYSLYMTIYSIEELVRRLNIANLEEVIWLMIRDDVIEKFRTLYNAE